MNYKDAGVDLFDTAMFNAQLAAKMPWLGGHFGAYDIGGNYLISATDSVGSKLKLYQDNRGRDGVSAKNLGKDLVAMVVNDIICSGARPMFMLDYLAANNLKDAELLEIIDGINDALAECGQPHVPLLGGESSVRPDTYDDGQFDLAGFGVGAVPKEHFIDGSNVKESDKILGLRSSGFHADGYTLIRRVLDEAEGEVSDEVIQQLLEPSRIYVNPVMTILNEFRDSVNNIVHVAGGGRDNILRGLGEDINLRPVWLYDRSPVPYERPEVMDTIQQMGQIDEIEMKRVFNDGIGMFLIVDDEKSTAIFNRLQSLGEDVVECGVIGRRVQTGEK